MLTWGTILLMALWENNEEKRGHIEERIYTHHTYECIIYSDQSIQEDRKEVMNQQGERHLITFLYPGSPNNCNCIAPPSLEDGAFTIWYHLILIYKLYHRSMNSSFIDNRFSEYPQHMHRFSNGHIP